MPAEPALRTIHATAVALGPRALLIRGASRVGKSRLAIALISRSSSALPIRLIGDDRILLRRDANGLVARPHPRIAGFIERRGLGLVAMPWVAQAPVEAVLDLRHSGAPKAKPEPDLDGVPILVVADADDTVRVQRVLAWWAGLTAAWAQHLPRKAGGGRFDRAKD